MTQPTTPIAHGLPLWKQILGFGVVGGTQIAFDSMMFVVLSWLGVAVPLANIVGRIAGASLGYWLNGRYTFAKSGGASALSGSALARFIGFWILTALISTALVSILASAQTLRFAWVAKPIVDGLLAIISFFVSKKWIYR